MARLPAGDTITEASDTDSVDGAALMATLSVDWLSIEDGQNSDASVLYWKLAVSADFDCDSVAADTDSEIACCSVDVFLFDRHRGEVCCSSALRIWSFFASIDPSDDDVSIRILGWSHGCSPVVVVVAAVERYTSRTRPVDSVLA